MSTHAIYGHRHFGIFFVPLVDIYDDGFIFAGRQYTWADVETLCAWRPRVAYEGCLGTGIPGARLYLPHGKVVKVNGRLLEREGKKPRIGFFSSRSDAFDEFLDFVLPRTAERNVRTILDGVEQSRR